MGRPSSYTEAKADDICELLAFGTPMKRICKKTGFPHYNTVLKWQRDIPEFADLSARAKEAGTHALADECLKIADSKKIDPADKRIRIDTRMRLIGKWNSRAYGDKLGVDITGNLTVNVTDTFPDD